MQTIGERLEEARKRKGISIREAAETTKIRGDYLQKFEANSFEVDLPPLYVRGFLRSYARFLELDPDRLVSDFDALGGRESKPARRETREVFGRVDFSEPARPPEAVRWSRSSF
jgi:cytoskeletal protein RodZ